MEAPNNKVTYLRAWLGIGLFTVGLLLLVLAVIPFGVLEEQIELPRDFVLPVPTLTSPESKQIDPSTEQVRRLQVLLENRILVLERPVRIRKQDNAFIQLLIKINKRGIVTVSAAAPGQPSKKMTVEVPGVYDVYNVVAIARLDLAGALVDGKEIRQPILPEKDAAFRWNIRANDTGTYRGVVWLHLDLVPKAGGTTDQVLLLARHFALEVVSVFGLPAKVVGLVGFIGLVLGTVTGYPFIWDWIRWLYRSARRSVSGLG